MSKYLTLDIETIDNYIGLKMGSGWVYKLNGVSGDKASGNEFKVLGCSVKKDGEPSEYIDLNTTSTFDDNVKYIQSCVDSAEILVAHNCQYDFGGLLTVGIDCRDCKYIDTMVAAKLLDSSLNSYALNFLGEKYCGVRKDNAGLCKAALDNDLFPWSAEQLKEKDRAVKLDVSYARHAVNVATISKKLKLSTLKGYDAGIKYGAVSLKQVENWCKSNMYILQEECYSVIEKYACKDTDLTYSLLMECISRSEQKDFIALCLKYSFPNTPAMCARIKGVRIDLKAAREALTKVQPIIEQAEREVYEYAKEEFNLRSNKDLPRIFDKLGVKYLTTAKGNPSFRKEWLEEQGHPICKLIVKARKYRNISNNFIQKIIDVQVYTLGISEEEVVLQDYGRLHCEWKVMSAKTGRMSCTNINLQQIPKRDKVLGPICRSLIVPEDGETLFANDWSNQEGRLHVHYAVLLNLTGAKEYQQAFLDDHKFDIHAAVSKIMGVDRDKAKIIYLAKAYGAGGGKICDQLNLPTKMWKPKDCNYEVKVAGKEGRYLIEDFNAAIPYPDELTSRCTKVMTARGYITTIGGRRVYVEKALKNGKYIWFYYRASSSLSQGSAADQLYETMVQCYKAGLTLCAFVHDETLLSGTQKQGEQVMDIMENCIPMEVPAYVEMGKGENWSEAH